MNLIPIIPYLYIALELLKQIRALVIKDMVLEWRQRYAINGILLYVVSTVFVVYISFMELEPAIWNVLFWIILLFTSVNAIAKSFVQEGRSRLLYYYTIARPEAIILSKMLYNMLLMLVISGLCLGVYSILVGNPVADLPLFLLTVVLGSIGFSLSFTMIAAIASKAEGNTTLMAILSFPVILPLLLLLMEISQSALEITNFEAVSKDLLVVLAIEGIIIITAYLLFPYLWKD